VRELSVKLATPRENICPLEKGSKVSLSLENNSLAQRKVQCVHAQAFKNVDTGEGLSTFRLMTWGILRLEHV